MKRNNFAKCGRICMKFGVQTSSYPYYRKRAKKLTGSKLNVMAGDIGPIGFRFLVISLPRN